MDLRQALLQRPEVLVGTMSEKLMTYALGRGLEATDMPAVRTVVRDASRDGYRFSALVEGDRDQHAVPDAAQGVLMFVHKLHLSRRTVLKGVGAALALPFLDAMVPALTAQARTAAAARKRLACVYVPHGVILDQWTPETSGATSSSSRS